MKIQQKMRILDPLLHYLSDIPRSIRKKKVRSFSPVAVHWVPGEVQFAVDVGAEYAVRRDHAARRVHPEAGPPLLGEHVQQVLERVEHPQPRDRVPNVRRGLFQVEIAALCQAPYLGLVREALQEVRVLPLDVQAERELDHHHGLVDAANLKARTNRALKVN